MEFNAKEVRGKVVFIKLKQDASEGELEEASKVAQGLKEYGAEICIIHTADLDVSAFDLDNTGIEPKFLARLLTRLLYGDSQDAQ